MHYWALRDFYIASPRVTFGCCCYLKVSFSALWLLLDPYTIISQTKQFLFLYNNYCTLINKKYHNYIVTCTTITIQGIVVLQNRWYLWWYNWNISKWDDFSIIIECFEITYIVRNETDLSKWADLCIIIDYFWDYLT